MTKLIPLDIDRSVSLMAKREIFLDPDFVYLPLPKQKQKMKKEIHIKKGMELFPGMYSPVSGNLINVEKCLLASGEEVPCLVIANDFQEKNEKLPAMRKRISHLSKETFLDSFYDERLKQRFLKDTITTFVVSGIDDDPYLCNEMFIQKQYTKLLLEMLDALLNLYPGSKAMIALKNTNSELILHYNNFIGMFHHIELRFVEDLYLIGREEFLIQKLHVKDNYVYLKPHGLYALYLQVKKRKPILETYVSITGDALLTPCIVETKLGTKVKDILTRFGPKDFFNYSIYTDGIMQGREVSIENLVVTSNCLGLVIMKKQPTKIHSCIKCGKCIQVCPIRSNPLLAYKRGKRVRCIHCGLCSYICPSSIPLEQYLRGEKNE